MSVPAERLGSQHATLPRHRVALSSLASAAVPIAFFRNGHCRLTGKGLLDAARQFSRDTRDLRQSAQLLVRHASQSARVFASSAITKNVNAGAR